MVPFTSKSTSKLRSALHFSYSIVIRRLFPALALLNPNNHYNHGFPNTFDYNHYVYSDYLVCSVPYSGSSAVSSQLLTLYIIEYL